MACLAPKRFFLGVGTGEALNEYSATGQWPEYQTRQEQMAEAIELMRALWSGEKITHRGTYYQTRQAKLYTRSQGVYPDLHFINGAEQRPICRQVWRWFDYHGRRGAGDLRENLREF